MTSSQEYSDYDYVMDALASGDTSRLNEIEQLMNDFPNGVDGITGRRWIINAIDSRSKVSVEWMLSRRVDFSFVDDEGYSVLHVALEKEDPYKLEVLRLLLEHGAPVNAQGINDWTPAHLAAVREDIEALKLLIRFGADLSIHTRIDDYATPLEEARNLGKKRSVEFLEEFTR